MKRNNQKRGFTIIELVIVIAVIAILAAVLIPTFSGVVEKAKKSKALQEAQSLYTAALALDLADGKQDGMDGTTTIATVEDKTVTYTVTDGKFVEFSYTDSNDYTAKTTDGTTWTVEKKSST